MLEINSNMSLTTMSVKIIISFGVSISSDLSLFNMSTEMSFDDKTDSKSRS